VNGDRVRERHPLQTEAVARPDEALHQRLAVGGAVGVVVAEVPVAVTDKEVW
jgi:hypothetical protein